MRPMTIADIVKRRFLYCVNQRHQSVREVVTAIGIPPGDLCRVITGQQTAYLPLFIYYHIACWLRMPLANVLALAGKRLKLDELIRLGMEVRGYHASSTQDQITAAEEVGISVAVFRRALHGYADFTPSIRTCDRLAVWLAWTGLDADDIVLAAGMIVRYRPDGKRVALTTVANRNIKPYPCACGRVGCMIPAHIPSGPRRKWRSDACRMWAKRKADRESRRDHPAATNSAALPHPTPIVRFITINERPVPVRF
jgi:hypothetical protein